MAKARTQKIPYFELNGDAIDLSNVNTSESIRISQRGALFALIAHFTVDTENPCIIAMPTGTGKTAVMMMAPFTLQSKRVLIVTSSRLVRSQIAEDFAALKTLKTIGAVQPDLPPPIVHEIQKRIKSNKEWKQLEKADVVVGLPNSISPGLEGVVGSPPGMFDLIIFDEAHHTPADSWHALVAHHADTQRALFTATPFRNDLRELPGRLAYVYPVQRAFAEGVLTKVHFKAVSTVDHTHADEDVAKAAEQVLKSDRKRGFKHLLVVRTDQKTRAEELSTVYKNSTSLKLNVIHSGLAYSTIKRTIDALRTHAIDGIICVDMLGEGFDLPHLKVAAIHSPHKSLAITLQFIGRFGRSNAKDIGEATFVAVPADVEIQGLRLYQEGVVWQEIIPNLADLALERERYAREVYEDFAPIGSRKGMLDPAVLRTFYPYCHTKIFELHSAPNFGAEIPTASNEEIVLREYSGRKKSLMFVLRRESYPKWSDATELARYDYHLFILYFNSKRSLLFVNSSHKSQARYTQLVDAFCGEDINSVPPSSIKKVLGDLHNYEFFNVGMRSRVVGGRTESYRIIAGPNVQQTVTNADANVFVQGHAFCKAKGNKGGVTIGFSTSGKAWQNAYIRLPDLFEWCDELAEKIAKTGAIKTNTEFDALSAGELVDKIPADVIAADWSRDSYQRNPRIAYISPDGTARRRSLLACSIQIDRTKSTANEVRFAIETEDGAMFEYRFTLAAQPTFSAVDRNQTINVVRGFSEQIPLEQYLDREPLTFYTANLGLLFGNVYHAPITTKTELPENAIETIDWAAHNVDICREKANGNQGPELSIHEYVENRLKQECTYVYCDDGTGEAADFVGFVDSTGDVVITLYHCKKSSEQKAGARLNDAYEVTGQAIKTHHLLQPIVLIDHIRRRFRDQTGRAEFAKGSMSDLEKLVTAIRRGELKVTFEIVLVQPGISKKAYLKHDVSRNLSGTRDYLMRYGCSFKLWCSA
jgi:superfamily II DNA or RNA helicase